MPELGNWRRLTDAVTWNARLKAVDGKYQEAFDNILSCYRAACQNCRNSSLLAEQSFGIMLKERILNVAVVILDRSKPRPADLKKLQDSLQGEFDSDTFVVDFETEKLVYYDILQRIFVYNRKGTGRLACSEAVRNGGRHYHWETFFACLIGPTENEMKRRIDEVFTSVESIKGLTPWQLNLRQSDFFGKLSLTKCENCYDFGLDSFFISFRPSSLYRGFYRQKAREEALLAILAVHRFRAEKGSFPASLDELVSNGFLQHLPPDPFSDGPLVYRADVNDFTLYSVGEDFKDDGGKGIGNAMTGFSRSRSPALDIVFWPPARPQPPDIFSLPLLPPRQPEKPATRPVPDI